MCVKNQYLTLDNLKKNYQQRLIEILQINVTHITKKEKRKCGKFIGIILILGISETSDLFRSVTCGSNKIGSI